MQRFFEVRCHSNKQVPMKTIHAFLLLAAAFGITSCTKDNNVQPGPLALTIAVPNGDFETWSNVLPADWETNSCPLCLPPYDMYLVRQDTSAYQGQFAAKFIYNNVFPSVAANGFAISSHPVDLKAYVKCNLATNDSVRITVTLFNNNVVVDNGEWYGTISYANYTQIQVPISQNATQADSVSIYIEGGHVNASPLPNTELWVDEVTLD